MIQRLILSAALACSLSLLLGALAIAQEPAKLTFDNNVQAVLRARCASCHNPNKRSGDLDVTSYGTLMQGGSSGAVIEAGSSSESYLLKLIKHEEEPKMPPGSSKIPQEEIDLIAQWVDGGVLENNGSKAVGVNKSSMAAAVAVDATARPAEPPLPMRLPLEPFVRTARTTAIRSMATSPWAPLIAIAAPEQVLLYRTDTLDIVGILPFPEGLPNIVRFSRDGKLVIAGGGRGAAKGIVAIWDVKSGERLTTVGDELDTVLAADISNDHSQIALSGPSRLVKIYSTSTGQLQHEIKKHTDWVTALSFSPDGVLLVSGDRNGGLHVWESATGREYLILKGHTAAITAVSWRIDSNALASSSEDTTIRIWEMENGNQVKNWGAHGGGALDVKYCRDGNLVSCGRDLATKLWDPNGAQIRAFPNVVDLAVATTYCDESLRVMTADWLGNITVWNGADAVPLGAIAANPPKLAERLTEATAFAQAKQLELDPVATQFAATEAQLNATQQALEASRQKMTGLQTEIATMQTQMDSGKPVLESMQAEKAGFEVELVKTKEAQPLLVQSLSSAVEAAKKLPENAELQKAADGIAEQVKQLDTKTTNLDQQIADRTTKIEAGTQTMMQMATTMAQKQAEMAAVTQEVQKLETTDLPPIKQQYEAMLPQVAALRDNLLRAQSQVARWQGELAFVEKLQQLQQQLAAAQQVIADRQTAVAAAQTAVDQAQANLNAAQANVQQAQAQADDIRRQMDEARQPTSPVTVPSAPQ